MISAVRDPSAASFPAFRLEEGEREPREKEGRVFFFLLHVKGFDEHDDYGDCCLVYNIM